MSEHDERACITVDGPVTHVLNTQGVLRPGEFGYWKIYAARPSDIKPGDLVMFKRGEDWFEHEVSEPAPWGDLRDMLHPRFRDANEQLFNIGALQPFVLLRKGTHNTLADSAW